MAHLGVPSAQAEPASAIEAETMRRVMWRLLPFLMLCYFIAYVDRVNAGFAALTMNRDVGLTQAIFGIGGGLFFVAYVLFEVPSNLAMEKVGARLWIARIMITWGLVGVGTAFIVRTLHVLFEPLSSRRGRSWLFSRRYLVPDLLVSVPLPRARGGYLHGRHSRLKLPRFSFVRGPARVGGGWRLARLAVAFHHRSSAGDIARPYGFLCLAEPPGRGQMADARTK